MTNPEKGDPDYFRRYYKKNKDEINRKRRDRYQEDNEYRSRSLDSSKKYREKRRKKGRVRVHRLGSAKSYKTGDGGTIKLYSVGVFSSFIGRSAQSISHWENKGIVPETPFRDTRGYRLYSRGMMMAIRNEVGDRRRLFPVDEQMLGRISDEWRKMGIPFDREGDLAAILEETHGKKHGRWVKLHPVEEDE